MGRGRSSSPNTKRFSRNSGIRGMAQALLVGTMVDQQNRTYPSWLFQCAAATRGISFPESAAIVNPIHVELGKAGDENDVDVRIAFQNFCAALSVVRR